MTTIPNAPGGALAAANVSASTLFPVSHGGNDYYVALPTALVAMINNNEVQAGQIGANEVSLAKMAKMSADGLIGNNTGGASDPQHLTVANVQELLMRYTESTITAAKTMVAGDMNKVWSIAGTTADYDITLPTTGLTTGDVVEFRVLGSATEIFTIKGTINGDTDYAMAARDILRVRWNGTDFDIIYRDGLVFFGADSNAGQSVTANTTDFQFEDNQTDTHQGFTGNDTYTAPQKRDYIISMNGSFGTTQATEWQLYINGSAVNRKSGTRAGTANFAMEFTATEHLNKGDTIKLRSFQSSTRNTDAAKNWLTIKGV